MSERSSRSLKYAIEGLVILLIGFLMLWYEWLGNPLSIIVGLYICLGGFGGLGLALVTLCGEDGKRDIYDFY